jgi:hypothetical protein
MECYNVLGIWHKENYIITNKKEVTGMLIASIAAIQFLKMSMIVLSSIVLLSSSNACITCDFYKSAFWTKENSQHSICILSFFESVCNIRTILYSPDDFSKTQLEKAADLLM